MRRKSISHFQLQALSIPQADDIKGGYSFCEWYMDLCISQGNQPFMSVMNHMMQLDNYFGFIPDMSSYGIIDWADD